VAHVVAKLAPNELSQLATLTPEFLGRYRVEGEGENNVNNLYSKRKI
jgi:hypothetical protein